MKNKQNGSAQGSKGRLANLLKNKPAKESPRTSNASPTILHPRSSLPELLKQSMSKPIDSKSLNEELCAVLATTHSIQNSIVTRTTSLFNSMTANLNTGPSLSQRANFSNLLFTTDTSETLFTEGPLSLKNSARVLNTELEFNRTMNFARKLNGQQQSMSSSMRSSPKCSLQPSIAHTRNSSINKAGETSDNPLLDIVSQLKLNDTNVVAQNPKAQMNKSMSSYMPRRTNVEAVASSKPASPRLNNIKQPVNRKFNKDKLKKPESLTDEVIENIPEVKEKTVTKPKAATPREKNLKPAKIPVQSARNSREPSITKMAVEKAVTPYSSPRTNKLANKTTVAAPKTTKDTKPNPSPSPRPSQKPEELNKVNKEAKVLTGKEKITSIVLAETNEPVVVAKTSVQVEITISEHQQKQQHVEKKSLQIIYSENNDKLSSVKTNVDQQQFKSVHSSHTTPALSLGSLISKIEFKEGDATPHMGMAIDLNFNTSQLDQVENPTMSRGGSADHIQGEVVPEQKTEKLNSNDRDSTNQGEVDMLPVVLETSTDKVIDGFLNIPELPSEPLTPIHQFPAISPIEMETTPLISDLVMNNNQISPTNVIGTETKEDEKEMATDLNESKHSSQNKSNKSFSSTDSEEEEEEEKEDKCDHINSQLSPFKLDSNVLQIANLERESSKVSSVSLSHISSGSPTAKIYKHGKRSSAIPSTDFRGLQEMTNFMKGSAMPWNNLKRRVSFVRSLIQEEEAVSSGSGVTDNKKRNSLSSSQATLGTLASRRRTSLLQTSLLEDRRRSSIRSGPNSDLSLNMSPKNTDYSQLTAAYLSGGQTDSPQKTRKSLFAHLESPEKHGEHKKVVLDTEENKAFKFKLNFTKKNQILKFDTKNTNPNILKDSSQVSQRESSQTFLRNLVNGGTFPKEEPGTDPLFADKSKIADTKETSEKQKTMDFSTLLQRYEEASPVASRVNLMKKENSARSIFSKLPTVAQKTKLLINIVPPPKEKEGTPLDAAEKPEEKQQQQNQPEKKKEFEYVVQGARNGENYEIFESFEDIVEKDFNLEIYLGEVGDRDQEKMNKFEEYFDPKYTFTAFFKYYEQIFTKKHPFAILFYEEKLLGFAEEVISEGRVCQALIFPFCISPTHRIMKIAAADRVKTEREINNDAFILDLIKTRESQGKLEVEQLPAIYLNDLNLPKHHTGIDRPIIYSIEKPFAAQILGGINYKHNSVLLHMTREQYETMDPDNRLSVVDYIGIIGIESQNVITADPASRILDIINNTSDINHELITRSLLAVYHKELRGYFQHNFFIKEVSPAEALKQSHKDILSRFVRNSRQGILARKSATSNDTVSSDSPDKNQSPLVAMFGKKMIDKISKRRTSNIRNMSFQSEKSFRNLVQNKQAPPSPELLSSQSSPAKPSITVQLAKPIKEPEEARTPPASRFKLLARKAFISKTEDEASKTDQPSTPSVSVAKDDSRNESNNEALQKPQLNKMPPKITKERSLRRIFVNNHFVQEEKTEKEKTFTKATVKAKKEEGVNVVKLFFTYVKENKISELKELFNFYPHLQLNIHDESGNYPIGIAAQSGFVDILTFLINKEADINVQNREGNTPLHLALAYSYSDAADELLQAGALQNIRNKKGRSPWECSG